MMLCQRDTFIFSFLPPRPVYQLVSHWPQCPAIGVQSARRKPDGKPIAHQDFRRRTFSCQRRHMMSDTNLRSNGQLSTRESESRIKAARVKLVPLKLGWHNEVSISSPITDINGIPRLGWYSEVSIPDPITDINGIPLISVIGLEILTSLCQPSFN